MESFINSIIGPLTEWLVAHPKVMAAVVAFLAVQKVISIVVDAVVSTRAKWDATPGVSETWYEKTLDVLVVVGSFIGKIVAQAAGFRAKPKAEIIVEKTLS